MNVHAAAGTPAFSNLRRTCADAVKSDPVTLHEHNSLTNTGRIFSYREAFPVHLPIEVVVVVAVVAGRDHTNHPPPKTHWQWPNIFRTNWQDSVSRSITTTCQSPHLTCLMQPTGILQKRPSTTCAIYYLGTRSFNVVLQCLTTQPQAQKLATLLLSPCCCLPSIRSSHRRLSHEWLILQEVIPSGVVQQR